MYLLVLKDKLSHCSCNYFFFPFQIVNLWGLSFFCYYWGGKKGGPQGTPSHGVCWHCKWARHIYIMPGCVLVLPTTTSTYPCEWCHFHLSYHIYPLVSLAWQERTCIDLKVGLMPTRMTKVAESFGFCGLMNVWDGPCELLCYAFFNLLSFMFSRAP